MKEAVLVSAIGFDGSKGYNTFDKKNIYFDLLKHKDELIEYEKKLMDFYKNINLNNTHK